MNQPDWEAFRREVVAARAIWMAENPCEDGRDHVTPFDRFFYPASDDKTALDHEREIQALRAERDHAQADRLRLIEVLIGIRMIIYPKLAKLADGRTMAFHSPLVHEQMQALSDRIRAIPGEIDALHSKSVAPMACTCPSGDGSLRWPCPAHPPETPPQGSPRCADPECWNDTPVQGATDTKQ